MNSLENQIFDGMDVYDMDGTKIGTVTRYDSAIGYFEAVGTFTEARYIPFAAIERVGPSGCWLNVTKSFVSNIYKGMPPVTPEFSAKGKLTGRGTVESGYTGEAVPLDAAGVSVVRENIHEGTHVFDADEKDLGTVQAYDGSTGYMRIEKGIFFPKDIFLPVTTVSFLDDRGIHLAEQKETIMNRFAKVPEVARSFFAL
jgi:hypothetical protein